MIYKEITFEKEMLVAAKTIIIEDMLMKIIKDKKYSDLDNRDKISLFKLMREREKLYNKPLS